MDALENWYEEKRSAYIYKALSDIEPNPLHRKLFLDLSVMAERQASIWETQLKEANVPAPTKFKPDIRTRVIIWLVEHFGVRALRIALAAMKIRGMSVYLGQPHPDNPFPTEPTPLEEHRHRGVKSGNNIRAAIFGMSDGLLSNASLMLGFAGASTSHSYILLSGIAGLLAGASSMGAGEYVSVRSQREMLEYQLELERNELELYPEEEAAELALIYQARGIPQADAERIAKILIKDPVKALDILAREELGINPQDLVSPWGAAISSFVSFSFGALIPLIPYLFGQSENNVYYTIGFTGLGLFFLGAMMNLFTQKSTFWGGLRMLLIGFMAGAITYGIGALLGVGSV